MANSKCGLNSFRPFFDDEMDGVSVAKTTTEKIVILFDKNIFMSWKFHKISNFQLDFVSAPFCFHLFDQNENDWGGCEGFLRAEQWLQSIEIWERKTCAPLLVHLVYQKLSISTPAFLNFLEI